MSELISPINFTRLCILLYDLVFEHAVCVLRFSAIYLGVLVCRGSAFPATSIAREEKCLWDKKKRLAVCGDFCVSPNVEGAIISGMAAASKFKETLSCL